MSVLSCGLAILEKCSASKARGIKSKLSQPRFLKQEIAYLLDSKILLLFLTIFNYVLVGESNS